MARARAFGIAEIGKVLVFPVGKLIEIIKSYGSKISSMETVVALLEQYKNVYIGFEFSKGTAENTK